jgi:hypothetical protein
MNNSYSSGLINSGNTNPLPFTSTLDATYRAPSVASSGGTCSSKMSGGYKYKKKKRLSKRHSKSKTSNEEYMFPSVNKIVGGRHCSNGNGRRYTNGGRRHVKRRTRSNRKRYIGMSLARGVSASRHFFGGNTNGSGNIPTFPTGYSLGGNYNTLSGAIANPPIYTPLYDHLIRQNV